MPCMCYSLCSVHYSLAQPLFGFNCSGSIAVSGSGEWGALLSIGHGQHLGLGRGSIIGQ